MMLKRSGNFKDNHYLDLLGNKEAETFGEGMGIIEKWKEKGLKTAIISSKK